MGSKHPMRIPSAGPRGDWRLPTVRGWRCATGVQWQWWWGQEEKHDCHRWVCAENGWVDGGMGKRWPWMMNGFPINVSKNLSIRMRNWTTNCWLIRRSRRPRWTGWAATLGREFYSTAMIMAMVMIGYNDILWLMVIHPSSVSVSIMSFVLDEGMKV